ncbi:hypothetical protein PGT21_014884 [Puccinia graminis f. sp. tritici]|uniref:Uncharacterized protein n=2 Tax=Puccinia graminis f. sp. tritici TaxID=56615 RepID=E3KLW7_PUCGT|nr:uncharacterized protein PGTG_11485 [Puccinia graminis f. sp. tritici CRL 75-36-700-3]EFP85316.2 hypothetical protein PGTG_11485 [Puccinia graminis f. sp. tritici CRL 75-36-700-3]KAA1111899.1 hypothetical protein PGT21_014884 [Puccinia graminis f. sp. tritici]
MTKWDIRNLPQDEEALSSDDEIDLGEVRAPRDRGHTFTETKSSLADRESLLRDLARLATVFDDVREKRPDALTRVDEDDGSEGIECLQEGSTTPDESTPLTADTSAAKRQKITLESPPRNPDTNGISHKHHARKPSMIDCRSIQSPSKEKEKPQEVKRDPGHQAQSGSHPHKIPGPEQPGAFAYPAKSSKA